MGFVYHYMTSTGIEQTIEFASLMQALRKASWDHETCGLKTPLGIQIMDSGYYMSQHEVLEKCTELGMFK